MDGDLIGELCRRSIQKYGNSVKLLRYNNHICYVNTINALFKAFQCTTCDTIFSKTGNLERHLVTCSDRVKHIYPKNVHKLRETLFEKLDAFNIRYKKEQKLFKNLAIFDFETICAKEESYKQTDYNLDWEACANISFYLVKLDSGTLFSLQRQSSSSISSFISALEGLATQGKTQMKLTFIEVETATKIKLCAIQEKLNERRNGV